MNVVPKGLRPNSECCYLNWETLKDTERWQDRRLMSDV